MQRSEGPENRNTKWPALAVMTVVTPALFGVLSLLITHAEVSWVGFLDQSKAFSVLLLTWLFLAWRGFINWWDVWGNPPPKACVISTRIIDGYTNTIPVAPSASDGETLSDKGILRYNGAIRLPAHGAQYLTQFVLSHALYLIGIGSALAIAKFAFKSSGPENVSATGVENAKIAFCAIASIAVIILAFHRPPPGDRDLETVGAPVRKIHS